MSTNPKTLAEEIGEAFTDAAFDGDINSVKELMKEIREMPTKDAAFYGSEALRYAAMEGHLPIVEYLLAENLKERFFNPNAVVYGEITALMWAASEGHLDIVLALLGCSLVDPTTTCFHVFDTSAITEAIYWGHADVAAALLADPRVEVTEEDLMMALSEGREDILNILLTSYLDL